MSRPMRWCLRSAAAVGRSSALMAAWVSLFEGRGIHITPLKPANCGFDVGWSEHFRNKFAGHPVKSVAIVVRNDAGAESWHPGEFVITETGVEGGVIYAVSAFLRDEILAKGVSDIAPRSGARSRRTALDPRLIAAARQTHDGDASSAAGTHRRREGGTAS